MKIEAGSAFRLRIVHNSGVLGQAQGHFRMLTTTAAELKRLGNVLSRLRAVLNLANDKRTDKRREQLVAYYRSVAPQLAPVRQRLAELDRQIAALRISTTYVVSENPEVKRPTTYMRIAGAFARKSNLVEAAEPRIFIGRDHHVKSFTIWMAGGGIKPGVSVGETDDLGYNVVKDPISWHDIHATALRLLGIDHTRLTYKFQGRNFRLIDTEGAVIQPSLA